MRFLTLLACWEFLLRTDIWFYRVLFLDILRWLFGFPFLGFSIWWETLNFKGQNSLASLHSRNRLYSFIRMPYPVLYIVGFQLHLMLLLIWLGLSLPSCYLFSICPSILCSFFLFFMPSFGAIELFMIQFYLFHWLISSNSHYLNDCFSAYTVHLKLSPCNVKYYSTISHKCKTLKIVYFHFFPSHLCAIVVIHLFPYTLSTPQYTVIIYTLNNQLSYKEI